MAGLDSALVCSTFLPYSKQTASFFRRKAVVATGMSDPRIDVGDLSDVVFLHFATVPRLTFKPS
jgi:hypothetical protein